MARYDAPWRNTREFVTHPKTARFLVSLLTGGLLAGWIDPDAGPFEMVAVFFGGFLVAIAGFLLWERILGRGFNED